MDTFISIIKSKKLRFSDCYSLNDYMEGRWVFHMMKKMLDFDAKNDKKWVDYTPHLMNCMQIASLGYCTCCFSQEGDLLSQWRAYANDGEGVAIGFSVNRQIDESIKSLNATSIYKASNFFERLHFCNVIYDEKKQIELLEEVIAGLVKNYNPKEGIIDEDNINSDIEWIIRLGIYAAIFKNSGFKEEKELRMFLDVNRLLYDQNIKDPNTEDLRKMCNFKTNGSKISHYFDFEIDSHCSLKIEKIILGPNNSSKEESIRFFMNINGYKEFDFDNIEYSLASYKK